MPAFNVVMAFRQADALAHKATQRILLVQCLPVKLAYPCRRTVSRYYDKAVMLIGRFGYGRRKVQQGCSRRNTHHDRRIVSQRHAQGIKSGAALVSDRIALYFATLIKVMDYGRIP